jgi:hypothetical protein
MWRTSWTRNPDDGKPNTTVMFQLMQEGPPSYTPASGLADVGGGKTDKMTLALRERNVTRASQLAKALLTEGSGEIIGYRQTLFCMFGYHVHAFYGCQQW